jgi:hypothetical protein
MREERKYYNEIVCVKANKFCKESVGGKFSKRWVRVRHALNTQRALDMCNAFITEYITPKYSLLYDSEFKCKDDNIAEVRLPGYVYNTFLALKLTYQTIVCKLDYNML